MTVATKTYLKDAVHHHRAASKTGLLERLFTLWFRGFIYNQIWEDPRVDAEAMQLDGDSRILTISSGGCNVLNYLKHEPAKIAAIDLNNCHMALTRLKLAGLQHLPTYEDFYLFFGLANDRRNFENYRAHLRDKLDDNTLRFWERSAWPSASSRSSPLGRSFTAPWASSSSSAPAAVSDARLRRASRSLFWVSTQPSFSSGRRARVTADGVSPTAAARSTRVAAC